jgi:hypothetical protein
VKTLRLILAPVALVIAGCAGLQLASDKSPILDSSAAVYILRDRQHAVWEHAYYICQTNIYAERCVFPGLTDFTKYSCDSLPDELVIRLRRWITTPGGPAAGPGSHEWYSKTTIPADRTGTVELAFFPGQRETDPDYRAFIADFRRAVMRPSHRVWDPPPWITDDERVSQRVGSLFVKRLPTRPLHATAAGASG